MMSYKINEGLTEQGTPDMKYYAFDWDDNIMVMPTKIILRDDKGNDIGMTTEDFAEFRTIIGKEPFDYEGHNIVGFSDNPFKFFGVEGDKQFLKDSMIARTGPAWNDFVEAVNNGSIFSIITARGHTPSILRQACYNLIMRNHNGIDSDELVKNLEKYRDLADENVGSKEEMINEYLDLCKFYPVSYGEGSATNPEEGKIKAMREYISFIREMSSFINKKAFLKNKVSNNFVIPKIGFSDDDIRNVEKMKKHFKDDELKIYYTGKGGKKLY